MTHASKFDGSRSSRIKVSSTAFIAASVRMYGLVSIQDFVIIDPSVTIGYPSPLEQMRMRTYVHTTSSHIEEKYENIVERFVEQETVIERGAVIRSGTVIYSGSRVCENADIAHNVIIREGVFVGRDCHLVPGAYIMADASIGHGCRIAGTICNRTRIGNGTSMLGHTMHRYKVGVSGHIEPSPTIGNGVIVGREAAVVGDVYIGDFAIVAAGSVITKSVPARTIWAGIPARQIGIHDISKDSELYRKVMSYEETE